MTSYAARYERGEHDEVWSELRELGSAALHAPIREDAEAVARAMARRARHNVELLVERLADAGFDVHSNDDDRTLKPKNDRRNDARGSMTDGRPDVRPAPRHVPHPSKPADAEVGDMKGYIHTSE
ncbi:hypothetical protein GCM10028784_00690 [Myceligenerans cantabricum]